MKRIFLITALFFILITSVSQAQWEMTTSLPLEISRPASATADGIGYLCGGEKGDLELSDRCFYYNENSKQWIEIAPYPFATVNSTGAEYNGELHIVGGFDGAAPIDSHYSYDASANLWQSRPALLTSLHGSAAGYCYIPDLFLSVLFLFGGIDSAGQFSDSAYLYDSDGFGFFFIGPLPQPTAFTASVFCQDKVWVIGGLTDTGEMDMTLAFADSEVGNGSPMPEPRAGHGAVCVDNEIWVIGGGSWDAPLNTTIIYSISDDTWRTGPPLNLARRSFALMPLKDSILVAGGFDGVSFLDSAEIYRFDDDDDDDDDNDDDDDMTDDDDDDDDDDDMTDDDSSENSSSCCGF